MFVVKKVLKLTGRNMVVFSSETSERSHSDPVLEGDVS